MSTGASVGVGRVVRVVGHGPEVAGSVPTAAALFAFLDRNIFKHGELDFDVSFFVKPVFAGFLQLVIYNIGSLDISICFIQQIARIYSLQKILISNRPS